MKLMVIESPNKIAKLQTILGEGWQLVASFGHVRDLPEREMGVGAPDYVPQYVTTEKSARVIENIRRAASQADEVFLATDPDREGEAIAWHIQTACGLQGCKRVRFNSITHDHVMQQMRAADEIDIKGVRAQEARRVIDRFVGYRVSPALSRIAGAALSAGRVQSIALRLVAERELAIKFFKPIDHFTVRAEGPGGWHADWRLDAFVTKEVPHVLDRGLADRVASVSSVTVAKFEEAHARRSPPAPFITSTLQRGASVTLKMSVGKTMETAQKLFEKGLITYHRTDQPSFAAESLTSLFAYCDAHGIARVQQERKFKSGESAQEGHVATVPTDFAVTTAGDSPAEQSLYRLIWQRAVASQMPDAVFATRAAELVGGAIDGKPLVFVAKGRKLVSPGWLSLTKADQAEEKKDDDGEAGENPVPALKVGERVAVACAVVPVKTRRPKRFTDAALVEILEEKGIGRPSSFASIITTLLERAYVRQEDDMQLFAMELGIYVYQLLNGKFAFMDFEYTRQMEARLDLIAHGASSYVETVRAFDGDLDVEIGNFAKVTKPRFPCPSCGQPLYRRVKDQGEAFWGCTGYPTCTTVRADVGGKPAAGAGPAPSQFKCKCGKHLIHRKKAAVAGEKGYDFFGCEDRACGKAYPNKGGRPDYTADLRRAAGRPQAAAKIKK